MVVAIKHMASNFSKLEKYEGVDFRRWQKKIHFLLSSMSVVYVLTTPMPEDGGDNPTMKQVRKRAKWDNDDYVCRGLILNEAKYMAEDASSKKFLISNFTNYKMIDSRPVLEQYNELLGILGRDFKHTLKHLKEELTLVALGSHLHIKESFRAHDNDKPKGNNVASPSVICVLRILSRLSQGLWGEAMAVLRLSDPKLKTLGERGIECIFVGYVDHSKAFRLYVIEPNESVVINSIIESMDAIFDEHRFSSVLRPSQRSLVKAIEDSGGSAVPEKVTEEVVQQPEHELRKGKRHRTPKDFRLEFQLYLIEGTRNEVSDQHSYYFNVEDDPKTFDEAMKSQDVAFWKKAIMMRWIPSWAITLGCWLIYLQAANFFAANGSLKEN
ncbi:hypothetical protein Tco_0571568 [Tanacetum coccineum]